MKKSIRQQSLLFLLHGIRAIVDYAKDILNQINISGEIAGVFRDSVQMYIPVTKPGHRISIRADIISGVAYIHEDRDKPLEENNLVT